MKSGARFTLRIARPTDQLAAIAKMYRLGLDLDELGRFEDHEGFDGVMLGHPRHTWHLEFTSCAGHAAGRAPTEDNLLVLYVPDASEGTVACARLSAAGFVEVPAFNPYWDREGTTFEDLDGYRVVIARRAWTA